MNLFQMKLCKIEDTTNCGKPDSSFSISTLVSQKDMKALPHMIVPSQLLAELLAELFLTYMDLNVTGH